MITFDLSDPLDPEGPRSQADDLLAFTTDVELFTPDADEGYATMLVRGHRETWPVRAAGFRNWLQGSYFAETRRAASKAALESAINTIEANARYDGVKRAVHQRVAILEDEVFVDLCNDQWQMVRVTPSGWSVVDDGPRFVRFPLAGTLPTPEDGGSLHNLHRFVNVADEASFRSVVAWMVATYVCDGPVPLLEIVGEKGMAKSTMARLIRRFVDPCKGDLRSPALSEHDLLIASRASHVLAFDNVTRITSEQSDALCRLITGGAVSRRQLYTDREQATISARSPVILTGVNEVATRDDLRDRTITIDLPVLTARQDEHTYWKMVDAAAPAILGALFDAVAATLRHLPNAAVDQLPRMADFARCARALEEALGWEPRSVERTMIDSQRAVTDVLLSDSGLIAAVEREVEAGPWEGTATDLLTRLRRRTPVNQHGQLPRSAKALSEELRRVAAYLRTTRRISVTWWKSGTRRVKLERLVQDDPGDPGAPDAVERAGDGAGGREEGDVPISL